MNFFEKAGILTRQRFGKTIQLYAPLYLSNECVDTCLYCGFAQTNKIRRKTLTMEEVLQEADFLIAQGFRHLLLVAGEHPKAVSKTYLCEVARALRPRLSSLSIEVAPFEEKDYREMMVAGVDGVVIYQETYNREIYEQVHVGGPKKNFDRRLRLMEEACRAGVRKAGIGILLGLAPWREDVDALIAHGRHLQKHFWQTEFAVSLPRLKPCASGFLAKHPVSDAEFAEIIATIRCSLPEVAIHLSTREPVALRQKLMEIGITHMSAGSRTEPGGYLHPEETGKQFELEDHRSPSQVAAAIQRAGMTPVWKDWEGMLT